MEDDISIDVPDGPRLEGRLALHPEARGGLVVGHPHPLYGGDMDNPVVVRTAEVAQESGLSTLRFNFRGVGRSAGVHARGGGERHDVGAALAVLHSRLPAGRPIGLAGYSFGAWIAARYAADPGIDLAGLCLIAPPLAMLDFATFDGRGADILVAAGTRDPYCPTPELEKFAAGLPGAAIATIDGADHFFFGKLFPLGEAIRGWVRRWTAL